ncbi:MAG: tyrosine-type recombinase/integrase [Deltaproteobacteria bacterium]|nr:tyrosine-type recombinase/integrase [Deltaproteobacteria bacterium]
MNAVDWIKEFENYLALVKNRSANTVKSYVIDAELLYRFVTTGKLGRPRVKSPLQDSPFEWSEFTEDMAVDYVRALKAKSARETSIARKIYSLRQFFKFLRKKGATAADPFGDMELHAIRRKLPMVLSVQEMNSLLTRIREPVAALLGVPNQEMFQTIRDRAMLETLYSAGLRVSELCNMNWADVDWNKREVTVIGKGNKERICPLGQKALEALLEHSRVYEEYSGKKPEGPAPVFLSSRRGRMITRMMPRVIQKWCRLAGVKRVNPHAFRHSAATHMLERGADIRVIQKMLGHASIMTTEIYTQVAIGKVKSVHANTHPRA